MEIAKSTRHSKIAGDYFEALVLYNLSKYGFECASVDHTGIDLIARNPHTKKLMGISVKGRTRTLERSRAVVTFGIDNKQKIINACKAFNCDDPYLAICVDETRKTRMFLVSLDHVLKNYPPGKDDFRWNMSQGAIDKYYCDPEVMIIESESDVVRWWSIHNKRMQADAAELRR